MPDQGGAGGAAGSPQVSVAQASAAAAQHDPMPVAAADDGAAEVDGDAASADGSDSKLAELPHPAEVPATPPMQATSSSHGRATSRDALSGRAHGQRGGSGSSGGGSSGSRGTGSEPPPQQAQDGGGSGGQGRGGRGRGGRGGRGRGRGRARGHGGRGGRGNGHDVTSRQGAGPSGAGASGTSGRTTHAQSAAVAAKRKADAGAAEVRACC